ncbi:MAG TPA: GNAT family protein [Jatrophihabitans sp.]|uniref:GNAT family N-acetyltransferase n=1 Tax=Jatrophihabitans sp. TaxID=1932789 RepID=UPI002E0CFA01|nr:GNAT family protein [Jatrophihabitans sp.]
MSTLEQIWPPFELRVTAGALEMRVIRDQDIAPLIDLALDGIHDPGTMPFANPWTDAPADEMMGSAAAYYWRSRAEFSIKAWTLDLAVRHEGVIVGTQAVVAQNYPVTRTGETGSWLGRDFQGKGIGTLMRHAVCTLMFDHLGAETITSGAFTDNAASMRVSRKLGYIDNGVTREERREGELAHLQKLLLTRAAFVRGPEPVQVDGAEALRAFLGLPLDE